MLKLPLVDRARFFVERQFVKGAGFQLLLVAAAIGVISVAGGAAIVMGDRELGFWDAVWWAFLRLTDPGYLGDDEGAWPRVVSTALTISGYVVFMGTLVAIMTRWLIARMLEFERGLTAVAYRNHVVIIGWTNRTVPLLRELLGVGGVRRRLRHAFGVRRLRVVVLTGDVSPLLSETLVSDPAIGRAGARDIILRYGSVLEEDAIRRAACLDAAAVIVPAGYGRGSRYLDQDVETIRGLLSMDARAALEARTPPLVVAEIQDGRRMPMARTAYRGPLEVIASDEAINRLLVQSVLHPGLTLFLREVLSAGQGNEFHVRPTGRLAGATLKEIAMRHPCAIVLGYLHRSGATLEPRLGVDAGERPGAGDFLVLLARTHADAEPVTGGSRLVALERRMPTAHLHAARAPTRVLVLGWGQRVPNLVAELARYPAMQFELDLVSMIDPALREREILRYAAINQRVAVRNIEADYLLAGELEKLDLAGYRAILLLSSDQLESAEEADARVVVGQRIIETLLADAQLRPQVLMELSEAANQTIGRPGTVETLASPAVLSHVMAQVALNREMRLVFDELFTDGGAEIAFVPPPSPLGGAPSFAQLEAAAASHGNTLLGVLKTGHELELNPPRSARFAIEEIERLCVLTRVTAR